MKVLDSSRFLRACVLLMLTSAVLHLLTLAVYFIMTHNGVPLNFFSIIGFDLFWPTLVHSPFAAVYSYSATIGLFLVLYFFFTHENRRT